MTCISVLHEFMGLKAVGVLQ